MVGDNTTGDQIWLIEPDKSNNRKIYQTGVPDEHNADFMTSLAWRPDAGELVFTSNHEEYCSWYNYDVYAILPDGSGYRRVTNSPACAGLASFPQGVVTLGTAAVPYDAEVYIQGAPMLKSAFGSSVTFDKVADFGSQAQPMRVPPASEPTKSAPSTPCGRAMGRVWVILLGVPSSMGYKTTQPLALGANRS